MCQYAKQTDLSHKLYSITRQLENTESLLLIVCDSIKDTELTMPFV